MSDYTIVAREDALVFIGGVPRLRRDALVRQTFSIRNAFRWIACRAST